MNKTIARHKHITQPKNEQISPLLYCLITVYCSKQKSMNISIKADCNAVFLEGA